MTYISEKYQLGVLKPYLDENYEVYITEQEIYSIPIDILALSDNKVISIELKSKDHKRGIAQAKRNTAYVDISYLCVWSDQVTENLINKIYETPIGLIAVDDQVNVLSEGEKLDPNRFANKLAREELKDAI